MDRWPRQVNGFTIIELLITLAIVTILAAIVYTSWPDQSIELNAQLSRLRTDIRYTQHLATTRGERYQLLRLNDHSYRIQSIANTPVIIETVTLTGEIKLQAFANNLIAFSTDGTPYMTAQLPGVALVDPLTITLVVGNQQRSLTITPATGVVT